MSSIAERISSKLKAGLMPERLSIVDDSDKHAGHAGWRPGGETHFSLEVVSARFGGLSRVERQRLVYGLLQEELAERVHALRLRTLTPDEDGKNPG